MAGRAACRYVSTKHVEYVVPKGLQKSHGPPFQELAFLKGTNRGTLEKSPNQRLDTR